MDHQHRTHPPGNITYNVLNGGPLTGSTYTTKLVAPISTTPSIKRPNNNFGADDRYLQRRQQQLSGAGGPGEPPDESSRSVLANYTWSHALDNGVNGSTFNATNDLLDPTTIAPEYGNSIYNVRHRLVVNAVMQSPWKREGWLGQSD